MRIKLKDPVLDYENKPISLGEKDKKLTYFDVFMNALNNQLPDERLTADKKNEIYQLTKKLYMSDTPNFTPEQLSLIKERVGLSYAPLVYGRVKDLVDGNVEPEKDEIEPQAKELPEMLPPESSDTAN